MPRVWGHGRLRLSADTDTDTDADADADRGRVPTTGDFSMIDRRTLLASAAALAGGMAVRAQAQQAGTAVIWSGFPSGGLGDQVTRPLLDNV